MDTPHHRSYASNKLLGKLFGCSGSKIRQLYMARFDAIRMRQQPLLEQIRHVRNIQDRQNFGYRYLKPHEIKWLTSGASLILANLLPPRVKASLRFLNLSLWKEKSPALLVI